MSGFGTQPFGTSAFGTGTAVLEVEAEYVAPGMFLPSWEATLECVSDGTVIRTLPLDMGNVTWARAARHRGTAQFDLTLTDLFTVHAAVDLLRYQSNVLLRPVLNGVPLGIYKAQRGGVAFAGASVQVDAADLSAVVAANTWDARVSVDDTVHAAIKSIVTDRLGPLADLITWNVEETVFTTGELVGGGEGGADPWTFVQAIAEAAGMEAFFEGFDFTLRTIPDPLTTGDSFDLGASKLIDGGRDFSAEDTFTHVIVRGRASDGAPIKAVYPDPAPSPGRGYTVTSTMIDTLAQAEDVAEKQYRKVGGIVEQVRFTSLVDATLRDSQVGRITDAMSGTAGRWMLDQVTTPMHPEGDQTGQTRERQAA